MIQNFSNLAWDSPQFYHEVHPSVANRVQFVEHRGRRMLVTDFTGADSGLIKAIAAECLHVVASQPPNSVLTLSDVTNGEYTSEVLNILTDLVAKNRPYVLRGAVVGVTGLRYFALQTLIRITKRPIKLFDTKSQALDWLAQDEKARES